MKKSFFTTIIFLWSAVFLSLQAQNCSAPPAPSVNWSGCDKSGVNLYNGNLAGANLADANLANANLIYANLIGANLSGANLSGADLYGVNLSGANLTGANLTGVRLSYANLTGANLTGANLSGADLSFANLSNANLSGANLTNATLSQLLSSGITGTPSALPADWQLINGYLVGPSANLANANLANVNLVGVNISGANLSGANLSSANLSGANLMQINLNDANLIYANLSGANVTYAGLQGANLTGANFTSANMYAAHFDNADLSNANLTGVFLLSANLTGATLSLILSSGITGTPSALPANWQLINGYLVGPSANLANANLANVNLVGVNISGANLSVANLSGANLSGAILYQTNLNDANLSDANLSVASVVQAFLQGANLTGANLTGANMGVANLDNADLSNANLTSADLLNASLPGANLSGANLSSTQLSGTNMSGAILTGAILTGAQITSSNLSGANLSGANLSGLGIYDVYASLYNSDLTGAILTGANLTNMDLRNINISGADLTGAILNGVGSGGITGTPSALPANWQLINGYLVGPGANLSNANLAGANLIYANLSGANFSGANLSGADLYGVNLSGANLTNANLTGARLSYANLTGANLTNANLSGADLSFANLSNANLSGANLTNATLSQLLSSGITGTPTALPTDWQLINGYLVGPSANLANANLANMNLVGVNISGANLSGANLSGANLSGAYLMQTNLSDANLSDANLSGANVTYAGLQGANLTGANFTSANLYSAHFDNADLSNANLTGVFLLSANLTGANLTAVVSGGINGTPYALPMGWALVNGYLVGPLTVTFDANGGTTPSPTTITVLYNATYGTLATASRPCYAFNGWFTASNGGTQITSASTVSITSNQTLYAQWTAINYNYTETIVACGSYEWHGTTYTSSTNNTGGIFGAGAGSLPTWTGTNAAGCDSIVTLNLTIQNPSTAPISISSSVAFAIPGTNFTLSVNGGSLGTGASWKWYKGSCGGTLVGTGASISVSQTANTTYFVRAEGTCNTTACATITVNIACAPQSVSASSTIVCLGSSTTLNVQGNLTAGASWKWYSGSCGTTLVGTGASISVAPTTTTTYYVRSEGGACGTTMCLSIAIQVRTIPSTPQGIIIPNQVCRNAMNTFSVQNPIAGLIYTWVVPSGWSITSGQGTATINVMVGQNNGQVSVKASNSCGSSALFNRSVGPINCRRSEEAEADAGMESARTEETAETLLTATDALNAIAVYPNPTTGEARITFSTTAAGKYSLNIVDLQGRVINSTSGAAIEGNNTLDINLSNCSNGVYMIHLMHNDSLQTLRVVKM